MLENISREAPSESEGFGMTSDDFKNQKIKSIIGSIKYYLSIIGPALIKVLDGVIYLFLKIIKSFFKTFLEMVKGG
ncbi:MAG: hypothetical protein UT56_C0013G0008 [Candidatus Levybacteria bacterium GW2011_GWB1_39_7]|nr:MAG: hypothetical protein UT56_C0013G0008 [Candidatus Levybacteria bacterium GW2011_GWB1_39_7]KKR27064.1 MAG: hypothetical protein UT57_C0021G0006 [Microgenomates group bacterium GW2011_GWC1_39_7]OGH45369.1 MAG: hypothetical protein A3H82_02125 [Candidatus Levybacteria bacterium RIFCSPLOWO2_02_FULL_39_26]OGH48485.1 MAG: hypothetical protein A3G66_02975 [Candidatus Levybacteria bacterium RIFCSPLOWO2_12_FULL_39_17]